MLYSRMNVEYNSRFVARKPSRINTSEKSRFNSSRINTSKKQGRGCTPPISEIQFPVNPQSAERVARLPIGSLESPGQVRGTRVLQVVYSQDHYRRGERL